MRLAEGSRPWSIWVFAGATSLIALQDFVAGLLNLERRIIDYQALFPAIEWNHDLAIIWLSSWLTIDLIPVGLVLIFAARFARWFVSVMALFPLVILVTNIDHMSTYPRFLGVNFILALIPLGLAALLWTRSASHWFNQGEGNNG